MLYISFHFSLTTATAQVIDTEKQLIKTIKHYKVDVNTGEETHAVTDFFDKKGNKTKSINYAADEEICMPSCPKEN